MKWAALIGIMVGAVVATLAWRAQWIVIDGAYLSYEWEPKDSLVLAEWCWVAELVATCATTFAMVVGARRNVIPRMLALVLAIVSVVALVALVLAVTGAQHEIVVEREIGFHDFHYAARFNVYAWLTIAGLAIVAASALWLWRLATGVARANAAALARIDREIAVRAGENPPPPEDDVPRL